VLDKYALISGHNNHAWLRVLALHALAMSATSSGVEHVTSSAVGDVYLGTYRTTFIASLLNL